MQKSGLKVLPNRAFRDLPNLFVNVSRKNTAGLGDQADGTTPGGKGKSQPKNDCA
nr:hypothetical protein [uncultured Duganella sp.]